MLRPSTLMASSLNLIADGSSRAAREGARPYPRAPLVSRSTWKRVLGLVLLIGALGACQHRGVSLPAPYRLSTGQTAAGSLAGPFTGKILDAATGEPISGALVQVTWEFAAGGFSEPAGSQTSVVSSDAAGDYQIAAINVPRGKRLVDAVLVVYKRGYVAYRSDRRFEDLGSRRDFVQKGLAVALTRWNDRYSHARHVRYLGGGEALTALSRWEFEAAAMELSGQRVVDGTALAAGARAFEGTLVIAAQLIAEADIKATTGFDGTFETGPLEDEPDTEIYSSQHFQAVGRPDRYDLAIRQWRFAGPEAAAFFLELKTRLKGTELTGLASQAFTATEGDIAGAGFLDASRGLVVLLTCGNALCVDGSAVTQLAELAHQRIVKALPSATSGQGVLP